MPCLTSFDPTAEVPPVWSLCQGSAGQKGGREVDDPGGGQAEEDRTAMAGQMGPMAPNTYFGYFGMASHGQECKSIIYVFEAWFSLCGCAISGPGPHGTLPLIIPMRVPWSPMALAFTADLVRDAWDSHLVIHHVHLGKLGVLFTLSKSKRILDCILSYPVCLFDCLPV